ncbi:MAG: hypothetical protein Tsb0020_08950 [Haliangiales bacterium]
MKLLFRLLQREALWPLLVVAVALVILVPNLGGYGFWEPHEIKIADRAHSLLEVPSGDRRADGSASADDGAGDESGDDRDDGDDTGGDGDDSDDDDKAGDHADGEDAGGDNPLDQLEEPPFSPWLMAQGMSALGGDKELGARLPLVLLGVLTVLATFFLGQRLASPRAGLLAALIMLSFPLVLIQSRQLTSELGATLGTTLTILGLTGLAWPKQRASAVNLPVDLLLVGLGATMSYYTVGLLHGVVAPFGAMGLACLVGLRATKLSRRPSPSAHRQLWIVTVATLAVTAGALAVTFAAVFDLSPPIPGERALFGYSVIPNHEYLSELGGSWRRTEQRGVSFNFLFEHIAFGAFPWSILAPIALIHLAMEPRRGRAAWSGFVPLTWAAVTWGIATALARNVDAVHFSSLAALAVAIGMWIDHLRGAREQADATSDSDHQASRFFGLSLRLPLVALFVFLAALVLGKDIQAFPDKVASLALQQGTIKYPEDTTWLGVDIKRMWLVFGALFGTSLGAGLWLWERRKRLDEPRRAWYRLGRAGVPASVAIGLGFALFIVQAWIPTLSHKLSSKHLYAAYEQYSTEREPLGVLGNPGGGLAYYASADFEKLASRNQLESFLKRPERVFALAPASDLCGIHRSMKGDDSYYVLDNSHAKFLLMSNQLGEDQTDLNPLSTAIVRDRPEISTPLRVNYDGRVELIGIDLPSEVSRGASFEVTLYFRVMRTMGGSWKIFAHFDGGGMRFQGDHEPIDGRCSTSYWQPGDYIVDTFTVDAGNVTYSKTDYTLYLGFFQGSAGNWRNMTVKSAKDGSGQPLNIDSNNRVNVDHIRVD